MALTNRFISLLPGDTRIGKVVEGAASTATAYVELRMMTNNGTNPTNLHDLHVLKALEVFKAYLIKGGINEFANQAGGLPTTAPPPALA